MKESTTKWTRLIHIGIILGIHGPPSKTAGLGLGLLHILRFRPEGLWFRV